MQLHSESWPDGGFIPPRFAAGRILPDAGVGFSDNISPHFSWSEVPAGTQSFALICHDPDAPSRGDDVNRTDREVPADLPRVDFFHWLLYQLPAGLRQVREGEFSQGFTTGGKPGPQSPHGSRQGLNDYTSWFAKDAERGGDYFGYDGPFPPFNDARLHHYVFTLYALNVPSLKLPDRAQGAALREALAPHVLASARWSGLYTLNARLRPP
jgi:Raf kinase inhibitor-like YbhB/YbcL family protein